MSDRTSAAAQPAAEIDLTGIVDMHLHSAPDVRPRHFDDIDLARHAASAGLRAIMIKAHVTMTADRATIAQKVVPTIRVFGGIVLNDAVGGLNPAAVEAAIRMGARQIWMPTISAAHHAAFEQRSHPAAAPKARLGITVLREDGALKPVVHEILKLIAEADAILGTAHLSPREIKVLVAAAQAGGVRRILVTHPELAISNIPLAVQQELAGPGVWFERCFGVTRFSPPTPMTTIAAGIRALGAERTIISTDLGKADGPLPVDGWRAYLSELGALGISRQELDRMARENPAALLGL